MQNCKNHTVSYTTFVLPDFDAFISIDLRKSELTIKASEYAFFFWCIFGPSDKPNIAMSKEHYKTWWNSQKIRIRRHLPVANPKNMRISSAKWRIIGLAVFLEGPNMSLRIVPKNDPHARRGSKVGFCNATVRNFVHFHVFDYGLAWGSIFCKIGRVEIANCC